MEIIWDNAPIRSGELVTKAFDSFNNYTIICFPCFCSAKDFVLYIVKYKRGHCYEKAHCCVVCRYGISVGVR